MDRRFRLPRVWSNRELKKFSDLFGGHVVNISAWKDEDKEGSFYKKYFSNASTYTITNFGGIRGQSDSNEVSLDLTKDLPTNLKDAFDVVFNHTTLEHIFDVIKSFENLCEMTKDIVILVIPFSQTQHETESFKDYWRFTPSLIRELFAKNKMHILYESSNKNWNSGIYLFFIASKHPELWTNKIKETGILKPCGTQIGEGVTDFLKNTLKVFLRL
ncbi:MAG: hypothetical protein ACD_22C00041G0006 [uncultured bacterium]|nr:MAG: hypothetical protein ACD_22C00041G0006 [uncultured bacterium]